jgi:flagellum-specific peptidoglycan hydrolase FlgJ
MTQAQKAYIESLIPAAKFATAGTKLFPETLISQLILESGWTPSRLAREANNWFGIKAWEMWSGKVISAPTNEQRPDGSVYRIPGTWKIYDNRMEAYRQGANVASLFRVYTSQANGFKDWAYFLQSNQRYKRAGVFDAKDPKEQFAALKKAGYATDVNYVVKLTRIFDQIKDFF